MLLITHPLRFLAALVLVPLLAGAAPPPKPRTSPYVTRAEAVMLLLQSRLAAEPQVRSNGKYPDVEAGSWYEPYVVLAAHYGLLEAEKGTNRLYPQVPLNRAAFMKMMILTFGLPQFVPQHYRDVQPRMWFAPYAGTAETYGLLPGDMDTSFFRPANLLTHKEVADALQIVLKLREKARYVRAGVPKFVRLSSTSVISTAQDVATQVMTPEIAASSSSSGIASAAARIVPPIVAVRLQSLAEQRAEVLALVNRERARAGLRALQPESSLESSAQDYAEVMARGQWFGHTSPTGQSFRERIESTGFFGVFPEEACLCVRRFVLGENLAKGQKSAEEVVRDWLASPAHRDALLSTRFTHTGIGVSAGLWVEHFGGMEKI